jgi:ribonucleoside-triphosphate reductase
MKIYKITEASEYLVVSINTLKTLANNNKINSFSITPTFSICPDHGYISGAHATCPCEVSP